MSLKINPDRLKANLLELAEINAGTKGYTRIAFSNEEKQALDWLETKLEQLPVKVSRDPINNVFGKWGNPKRPSISFGSHLDTVVEGGLYDGALGVVAGLECLETLYEHQYEPQIPLELACFVGEEIGTIGSKAVVGLLEESSSDYKKLNQFGITWDDITTSKRKGEEFLCYLELHIEQGSLLEKNRKLIGIVNSISGYLRKLVRVKGQARHSGTTPMHLRHDALVESSKLIQVVYDYAKREKGLATIGEMKIKPNLANVIPGEVELTLEIRGDQWENIMQLDKEIMSWLDENIDSEVPTIVEKRPKPMSRSVQADIDNVCQSLNIPYQYLNSGANHDASSMTTLTDVGMIFVPSKNGISHHPEEWTSWEDIENGANVMLNTILNLSNKY